MTRWLSPPDRRECFLAVFCIATFTLSFNLHSLGFNPSQALLHGLAYSKPVLFDGRRPAAWRDELEDIIFGDWSWEPGHIAGHVDQKTMKKGEDEQYSAIWIGKDATGPLRGGRFGDDTVNQGIWNWGDHVPSSKILLHTPGYTVLENVILFNGTTYVVMDLSERPPPMSSVVSGSRPGFNKWQYITPEEARSEIGDFGAIIRGTSWLVADPTPSNSTLLSLFRMHTALDPTMDPSGATRIPPPRRLILPNTYFFSDPSPYKPGDGPNDHYREKRVRSDTGFHHLTAKAALPRMTVQYETDWADYHHVQSPFLFLRMIVIDTEAAGGSVQSPFVDLPTQSLQLEHSHAWIAPMRRALSNFFGIEGGKSRKPVITYLSTQSMDSLRLRLEDHEALVSALQNMGGRYEVHIVDASATGTEWRERMGTILRSSVVVGPAGGELMDAMFMDPSNKPAIVELFPPNTFSRDRQVVAASVGIRYRAWRGNERITEQLPPEVAPPNIGYVSIDANEIVQGIRDILGS